MNRLQFLRLNSEARWCLLGHRACLFRNWLQTPRMHEYPLLSSRMHIQLGWIIIDSRPMSAGYARRAKFRHTDFFSRLVSRDARSCRRDNLHPWKCEFTAPFISRFPWESVNSLLSTPIGSRIGDLFGFFDACFAISRDCKRFSRC